MKILRTSASAQKLALKLRSENKTIGFVPTMGYLHEGHLSLIKIASKKADVVFVSIFVNPLQFGLGEDFERYPRDLKRDEKLCRDEGVDYIFYPENKDMYPEDYSTYTQVEKITEILEGKIRPGHFKGVTTVCLKLFNIIQPHFAVFGQKDAQQLIVIRKMVRELNLPLKIVAGEIKREPDGLAMSSRNTYLNKEQREDATVLYRALNYAKRKIEEDYNRDIDFLSHQMYKLIKSRPTVTKIDYIAFNNNRTLEEIKSLKTLKKNTEMLISLAVRFGKIRLIDNFVIKY
jgi:pantoate--beta-alanine ligase